MFPEIINTRPVRVWLDDGLNWIVLNWGDGFEAAAYPLLVMLNTIEDWLLAVPWWMIILVLAGLAYGSTRKFALPVVVVVGLVFMGMGLTPANARSLWTQSREMTDAFKVA